VRYAQALKVPTIKATPMTEKIEHSREQLIDALIAAYRHLKDEGDWDTEETEEQYLERLTLSSMDELIEETCTDDEFPLEEFFYAYT
tara:strand:- start:552 stop:812 length:261 start_codon:yes stop_codon:yes gene_type:complete